MNRLFITLIILLSSIDLNADDSLSNTMLTQKIKAAKSYCEANNLNTEYAIFIDMSIHSGKYRLFVIDLKNESVVSKGLCSHGCCDSDWGRDQTAHNPTFSNIHESHCSSLGKYKIGARGYSSWGIHVNYKLYGLDPTNSNAFERLIVLHSWNEIPDHEVFPNGAAEGWGCPAVSNNQMKAIDKLLKTQTEPVLLWIYN